MTNNEYENSGRYLYDEFAKVDIFYARIKDSFILSIMNIIQDKLNTSEFDAELYDYVSIYGQEIINTTESVIDKDRNYPEQRLVEELERTRKVVAQLPVYEIDSDLMNKLHQQVKVFMVDNFKNVFQLSTNGFLLLELSAKMHTLRFLVTYRNVVEGSMEANTGN